MRKYLLILIGCLSLVACDKGPQEYVLGPVDMEIVTSVGNTTIQLLYPSPRSVKFNLQAGSTLPDKAMTIELKMDPSLVASYNQEHNTNYKTPPANLCEFTKGQVIIPRFNGKSTDGNFIIKSELIVDDDEYLVPLVPKAITGKEDVSVKPLYLVCKRFDVGEATNIKKTNWKLLYFNSEESGGNYASRNFVREDDASSTRTGWAKDLIDGSYASIWAYGTQSIQNPYYFVIDLGKNYTIRQIALFAERDGDMSDANNTVPKRQCGMATFEFATELTGEGMADKGGYGEAKWFGMEEFGADILKNQIRNDVYFSELKYARYIRFAYYKCYSNSTLTAPAANYSGGALAELDIFGYDKKIEL